MKFKFTVLNIFTIAFLLGCIIYTVVNYPELSEAEGWGVVFMIGIFCIGTTAFIPDLLIRRFIKNQPAQTIAGIIVIVIYAIVLYFGSQPEY
jgi:uncharacterized PurR-regulated membrane protein YhhQ (DUF165 family)